MKFRDIVKCLTKYYVVFVANNSACYEDQTAVPDSELDKDVKSLDFYEDDGNGEMLLVNLKNVEVDDRQMTFSDIEGLRCIER